MSTKQPYLLSRIPRSGYLLYKPNIVTKTVEDIMTEYYAMKREVQRTAQGGDGDE